jgi:superfamily II DNA helicase RecQ
VAMLVGDLENLPEPLTRLSTTGLLRDQQQSSVERWIDAACAGGLIRVSADQYRTLSLTPLGREVMSGRTEDVHMTIPATGRPESSRRSKSKRRGRRKLVRRQG